MTMFNRAAWRHALIAGAATATLLSGGAAHAATVTFSNTIVQWFGPTGESVPRGLVTYTGNGTADARVAWGSPFPENGDKSSFRFVTAGDPILADPGNAFTLGTFTHANNPTIYGLVGVNMRIAADIAIDGVAAGSRFFDYVFDIEETPNTPPCQYGGVGAACNDRVSIAAGPGSQTFDIGGRAYTLAFSAFQVGGVESDGFISPEGGSNEAQLRALVTVAGVPEPATWALMILGFGAVAGAMRRRSASPLHARGART